MVELLVVIAIIGILISLTLPAIQIARESARKAQCRNNLKQIGLAFHHHHQQHKFFPSGGWDWTAPPTYVNGIVEIGGKQQAGWGFQILPFIEGQNAVDAGAAVVVGTPQSVFFCSSRREPQRVSFADKYEPKITGTVITHALCDYAASNREGTGVVRRYQPLTFAHIKDGASNTLLVGEKRMNVMFLGRPQDDDNEGYTSGWNEDTIRRTNRAPAPDYRAATGDGEKLFGGPHSGVFFIALVDGSVRSIAYKINPRVFRLLGDRDDGQPIDLGDS